MLLLSGGPKCLYMSRQVLVSQGFIGEQAKPVELFAQNRAPYRVKRPNSVWKSRPNHPHPGF